MLFPTLTFAVFFAIIYGAHVVLRTRTTAWKLFMIGASYVFYGWWNWRFCALIAGSTAVNWLLADAIQDASGRKRRRLTSLTVVANLSVLGLFKYYDFFVVSAFNATNGAIDMPILAFVLPVGISFYTFQALSYVLDISRRDLKPAALIDFAFYLAFFPQLVAGPIVRAKEFIPQLERHRQPRDVDLTTALWLIGRGLFKKVVVATYLSTAVVDNAFGAPTAASREELLLGFYGYAIQIYADFSGYTDIAIGIALLLGFEFPQNFDRPYSALSIQDFWRRWHITLSTWLRDYLYISLGGNRGGTLLTTRNLLITMGLGGLWHGASWTMVGWGLIHGVALVVERLLRSSARVPGLPTAVRWFVTFHLVSIAWVLFRADSFSAATDYLTGLFSAPFGGDINNVAVLLIVVSLVAQLVPPGIGTIARAQLRRQAPAVQGVMAGLWIWLVITLGPAGVAPFIYFQF